MKTTSTSAQSAVVTPLILRQTDHVRLLFCPMLVENPHDTRRSVKGTFIYQRKLANQQWGPYETIPLSTLKADEGYKLELKSEELLEFFNYVQPLYELVKEKGIPRGQKDWINIKGNVAAFLKANQNDLATFLNSHPQDAASSLSKILNWLSTAPKASAVASQLTQINPQSLPNLNAVIGLSAIKEALAYWEKNQNNPSEVFWQNALSDRAFVMSQVFAYPVVKIGERMYVGGKRLDDKGGGLVDFVQRIKSTGSVILVEIKTPQTRLLGGLYRDDVYPLHNDVSGAIAQVLKYRQTFMKEFHTLVAGKPGWVLSEPRCLVIAGNVAKEIKNEHMRNSFELHRERLQGITVMGYDELFERLRCMVALLEGGESQSDEDIPF
jgi:hypothetical protein